MSLGLSVRLGCLVVFALGFPGISGVAQVQATEVDAENAMTIARRNNCLRCHAVDKRKKAPSYQEIAKKFNSKPDAEGRMLKHVTSFSTVKVDDKDEEHKEVQVKDDKELKNFVQWMLTR